MITLPSMALVRRELVRSLRLIRVFLVVLAAVLVLSIVVLENYPNSLTFARAARASQEILSIAILMIATGVCLLIPGYASTAILAEREERTYELLKLTMIRPFGIVFGKLLNAVGFFGVLVLACAPVVASVSFLVGIELRGLGVALAVMLVSATAFAAIGIACSTLTRHVLAAVILSYLFSLLFFGGIVLLLMFLAILNGRGGPPPDWLLRVFFVTCPMATLAQLVMERFVWSLFIESLLYEAAVAALCLLFSSWRLRQLDTVRVSTSDTGAGPQAASRPPRTYAPIRDGDNPIYLCERRWGGLSGPRGRFAGFLAILGVLFLSQGGASILAVVYEEEEVGLYGFFLFVIVVFGVACPALCANAVTKEYARGNMDMLRMTLLGPWRIMVGKWLAGFRTFVFYMIAAVAVSLMAWPFALMQREGPYALVTMYGTLFVSGMLSVSLGLLASLLAKRTMVAVMGAYLLCGLAYGLLFIILMLGSEVFDLHLSERSFLMKLVIFLCPPVAYVWNMSEVCDGYGAAGHFFSWCITSPYWWMNVLFHVFLSLAILQGTVSLFSIRRMRER